MKHTAYISIHHFLLSQKESKNHLCFQKHFYCQGQALLCVTCFPFFFICSISVPTHRTFKNQFSLLWRSRRYKNYLALIILFVRVFCCFFSSLKSWPWFLWCHKPLFPSQDKVDMLKNHEWLLIIIITTTKKNPQKIFRFTYWLKKPEFLRRSDDAMTLILITGLLLQIHFKPKCSEGPRSTH